MFKTTEVITHNILHCICGNFTLVPRFPDQSWKSTNY